MKLVIDLRIPPMKLQSLLYATMWVKSYLKLYREDTLFWIGLEWVVYDPSFMDIPHVLIAPQQDWIQNWRNRRKIYSITGDVIFSFSDATIFPANIPILRHISGYEAYLVPENRKPLPFGLDEYTLVSNPSKKRELIERFSLDDAHILIISDWIGENEKNTVDESILDSYAIKDPYIIHDMGFEMETQLEKLIIYSKEHTPSYQLIILGKMNAPYEKYRDQIRESGLFERVRILWILPAHHLETLYQKAHGWIYTGYHYSGSLNLQYALSHTLPMVLSDLEEFRWLPGVRINHHRRAIEEDIEALFLVDQLSGHGLDHDEILRKTHELLEKIWKKEIKS